MRLPPRPPTPLLPFPPLPAPREAASAPAAPPLAPLPLAILGDAVDAATAVVAAVAAEAVAEVVAAEAAPDSALDSRVTDDCWSGDRGSLFLTPRWRVWRRTSVRCSVSRAVYCIYNSGWQERPRSRSGFACSFVMVAFHRAHFGEGVESPSSPPDKKRKRREGRGAGGLEEGGVREGGGPGRAVE